MHRVMRSPRSNWMYTPCIMLLVISLLLSGCTLARPEPRPVQTETSSAVETPPQFPVERARVIGDRPDTVAGQVVVKLDRDVAVRAMDAAPQSDGVIATGEDGIDQLNREFQVTDFEPLIVPVAGAVGMSVDSMAASRPTVMSLYIAGYEAKVDPEVVAAAYRSNPDVIYAEPNFYAYADEGPGAPVAFEPNDPYFDRQWNMKAIQLPQAWDISEGQNVVIAVLDSGIAYEDYERFRQAPDLSSTRFVPGYDFINEDNHPNDDAGHGTHVAGTIAQSTNNGQGVVGVSFGATLMPVKVLDCPRPGNIHQPGARHHVCHRPGS